MSNLSAVANKCGRKTALALFSALLMISVVMCVVTSDTSDATEDGDYKEYYKGKLDLFGTYTMSGKSYTCIPELATVVYNKLREYDTPLDGDKTITIPLNGYTGQQWADSAYIALKAFTLDHPEYFWINPYKFGSDVKGGNFVYTIKPSEYTGLTITDAAGRDKAVSDIKVIMDSWGVKDADTVVTKLTKINTGLTGLLNHGKSGTEGNELRNVVTAFLSEEHKVVCAGYSASFKYCCDYFGIPCLSVVGDCDGAHEWNYAQVDGTWYFVDPMYDDNGTEILDHFLLGSKSSESSDHIAHFLFDPTDSKVNPDPAGLLPTLSEKNIMYTIKFVDWNGTVIDSTQYEAGDKIVRPSNPTREGYTFDGWKGLVEPAYAYGDATYKAAYVKGSGDDPISAGMCGSTIAAIVIAMCSIAAIPAIRFLRL